MSYLRHLTDLIGTQALSDHLNAAVQDLIDREQVTRHEAYQQITTGADAADPAVIAATRQTWTRRADADPDEVPAKRLYVLERLHTGIVVATLDLDAEADRQDDGSHHVAAGWKTAPNDHSHGSEIPVEVLDFYQLQSWEPFEHLLPTAGDISNIRPSRKP